MIDYRNENPKITAAFLTDSISYRNNLYLFTDSCKKIEDYLYYASIENGQGWVHNCMKYLYSAREEFSKLVDSDIDTKQLYDYSQINNSLELTLRCANNKMHLSVNEWKDFLTITRDEELTYISHLRAYLDYKGISHLGKSGIKGTEYYISGVMSSLIFRGLLPPDNWLTWIKQTDKPSIMHLYYDVYKDAGVEYQMKKIGSYNLQNVKDVISFNKRKMKSMRDLQKKSDTGVELSGIEIQNLLLTIKNDNHE